MKLPAEWDVYLVTDRAFSRGRTTLDIVTAASRGGISAVQLREKELSTREFLQEGLLLKEILAAYQVPFIINDRIDIALALDADGVHLGQKDMPVTLARKLLGPQKIVGLSINTLEEIDEEAFAYADYLAISPVFFTSTKADISRPWGLEGIHTARALTHLPLVGIGGINLENAQEVTAAGIDCVAVVTAITSADDPENATRELLMQVQEGKKIRERSTHKGC